MKHHCTKADVPEAMTCRCMVCVEFHKIIHMHWEQWFAGVDAELMATAVNDDSSRDIFESEHLPIKAMERIDKDFRLSNGREFSEEKQTKAPDEEVVGYFET